MKISAAFEILLNPEGSVKGNKLIFSRKEK